MGPLASGLIKAIPSLVSAMGGFASQIFSNRSARREYDKARDYNTPASQMQRFKEAGLSPWLAYGQANSGNVSGARPAQELGGEHIGKGVADYMSMANFDVDLKNKWMQYWNVGKQNELLEYSGDIKQLDRDKKQLEMYADYPTLIDGISRDVAMGGYRAKLNELKRATAQATVEKLRQNVQNLKYKNIVDSVRAKYAKDYGMVGGDWTQGLGLLKSIPQAFKKGSKSIPKGVPPWRGSIQTNPILNQRLRRRLPSKGVINP